MAGSTYSTNLKIELMTTGENSGTWGDVTNTNLGTALEQAIVGYGNPDYASDANLTISITNSNAAQAARALVLNVTSVFGSLTQTRELVVPTIQKQYIVQNNTTGGQSITVKTSAGTGITVPNGRKAHLYVDGTNVIQMFDYVDINGGAIDGTTIGGSSASTGAFTTLAASGATTLNGAVTLGDAAGDNITINGTVTSHLLFTDNTYDIGASGATRPRNLYLAGAATIGGNLSVGGTLTLTGGLTLNGNVTVGDSASDTLTINSTVTSNLIFTDNTYDIGASGATRPRNLFLGGNATIGGNQTLTGALTVDSTTDSSSTTTGSIQTDGGVGIAKSLYVGGGQSLGGNLTFAGSNPTINMAGNAVNQAATINNTNGGSTTLTLNSAGLYFQDDNLVNFAVFGKTEAVFNETGRDTDFRVESDTDTHMLFVDAGTNTVNIGGTPPTYPGRLNVGGGGIFSNATTFDPDLADNGTILLGNINDGGGFSAPGIGWKNSGTGNTAAVVAAGNTLYLGTGDASTANSLTARLNLSHLESVFNESGLDVDFRVESDTSTHALFVDAGTNRIGVNMSNPQATFHVAGATSDTISADTAFCKISAAGLDGLSIGALTSSPYSVWMQSGYTANGYSPTFNNGYPLLLQPYGSYVGIRRSSASYPLHVGGSVAIEDASNPILYLVDTGNSTSEIGVSGLGSGLDNIYIAGYNGRSLGTYDFRITGLNGEITARAGAVFNESGADSDFRVESTTNASAIFVDASLGTICINGSGANGNSDIAGFQNLSPNGVLSGGSGFSTVAVSRTQNTAASNNSTVDAFRFLDVGGARFGSSWMSGHFYVSVTGASGANQYAAIYKVLTTGNGTTFGDSVFSLESSITRGTSPVSSVALVDDGTGGFVKLQITYINNSGVVTGGSSVVTFIGQTSTT